MDREALWKLFQETGAPEFYLMYHREENTAEE